MANDIEKKWADLNIAKDPQLPVVSKETFYHNWLYSVVPVSERVKDYEFNNGAQERYNYPLGAYLVGYCRNCGKAFSAPVPATSTGYLETQLQVAKEGCVAP